MSLNVTEFVWNDRREQAALLVAQDAQTDEAIASACGVTKRQLERWKQHPGFQGRVQEHVALWREQLKAKGLLERQNRLDALNDRWERMHRVIAERAADEASGAFETVEALDGTRERLLAPGWKTGLLVRTEKQIGAGERAVHVVEFAVDTGLLRELRAHEEQAAKELGEWPAEKGEGGEGVAVKVYVAVDVERV